MHHPAGTAHQQRCSCLCCSTGSIRVLCKCQCDMPWAAGAAVCIRAQQHAALVPHLGHLQWKPYRLRRRVRRCATGANLSCPR